MEIIFLVELLIPKVLLKNLLMEMVLVLQKPLHIHMMMLVNLNLIQWVKVKLIHQQRVILYLIMYYKVLTHQQMLFKLEKEYHLQIPGQNHKINLIKN